MIKKLLKLIQEALNRILANKTIKDAMNISIEPISQDMQDSINLWRLMYKDSSPWLDDDAGIYSLGLAKQICKELQQQVLSELDTHISDTGADSVDDADESISDTFDTRAKYLNAIYTTRFLNQFPQALEKALALGGMIIKPYFSNNDIYYDYCYQGEFYPIAFDDDGNIVDIAFYDSFTDENYIYTKIERQEFIFAENKIVVTNTAYKAKAVNKDDDTVEQDLGNEIPLTEIDKWANLEPLVTIENVEKPIYGYFKVPTANNIDLNSPLGISIFSPVTKLIKKADEQFSRLDWEYDGGQLAIDIDPTAVHYSSNYYGSKMNLDKCQDRLYRKVDLGQDDTYNAWTPALRDANYINGLNVYLCKIEDIIGLARGTLSQVESEARTATELKLLKQRTYITVTAIQNAAEKAIKDLIYATDVLVSLYNLAPKGNYDIVMEWQDSILTDTDTELAQLLNLEREGIISKAEVRAWYKGEPLEKAQAEIAKIEQEKQAKQLNDIFSNLPSSTLENNGSDDETSKNNQNKDENKNEDKEKE